MKSARRPFPLGGLVEDDQIRVRHQPHRRRARRLAEAEGLEVPDALLAAWQAL